MLGLQQRITFLSIVRLAIARLVGALLLGAGRKLPAHPRPPPVAMSLMVEGALVATWHAASRLRGHGVYARRDKKSPFYQLARLPIAAW